MYLLVALFGGLGSILRYLLSRLLARIAPELPFGTLIVNWTGSLLTGVLGGALARRIPGVTLAVLVAGLLGGFTTFSSFTYETMELVQARELLPAAGNVALSLLGGAAFVLLGLRLS